MEVINMKRELMLESNSAWSLSSADGLEPPKKKRVRARLDHMTPEQKQERRKEKNRQAAQTARDRKREKLDRLEEENRRLREENMRLRSAILGNSREQSVIESAQQQQAPNNPLPPVIQITTDSGVSDVETKSASTSLTPSSQVEESNNPKMDRLEGSDGRTMTPDSSSNYGTATLSPAPSDEYLINSIIERDNDVALVNEVQKLVSYVNGDVCDDVSFGSAALISEPQQQVQGTSTTSRLVENSLGWTSVQLMLILLISRIHHRLSAKINCCPRGPTKSIEGGQAGDELDPNCNLYDYILHTKCANFRRAAETIISNKNNVRHQRLIALEFVQKYLTNIARQSQSNNIHNNNSNSNNKSPAQGTSCLVRARQ